MYIYLTVVVVSSAVWWSRGHVVWVGCCLSSRTKRTPCKPTFTGHAGLRGCCRGLAYPSVWLLGWCHGCGGWCGHCFVARVHENEKKPCKRQFTGLVVVYMCSFISLDTLLPVCRPSRVVRRGGMSRCEIETKKTENRKRGGSQTPQIVARVCICCLDQNIRR